MFDKRLEAVAKEAARLRYDNPEEFREYLAAKKEAAKKLGFTGILPPNSLIHQYYHEIADVFEGKENREQLLYDMREEALRFMTILKDFNPKVIGSVERGDVTKKSDVDIHVFVDDDYEEVLDVLNDHLIQYEYYIDEVKEGDEKVQYHHIYIKHEFDIEISMYIKDEYKQQTCSIFGKPIKGIGIKQLEKLLNVKD